MVWLVRSAIVLLYPRGALPGAADCDLDAFLAQFKREVPLIVWVGTVFGALLFQLTPVLTVFVPLPAFLLPASLADKHAQKVTSFPLYLVRQPVFLVKMCAGFAWGTDPHVRARLGLRPLAPDAGTWRQS